MLVNLFSIEMPESEINKAMNDKFISKDKFVEDIEKLVLQTKQSYIDAIVSYCEDNNIDIDRVNKLVTKPLKEKIRYEATELNYLKRTSHGKLPL
jgi:hypothetical protein